MKSRKLVIFDLNGTLFRTETVDIAAYNRALAANGIGCKTNEEILDCIGLTIHEACLKMGIAPIIREKFMVDVIRFEKEEISNSGNMYDGAVEFLKRLKAAGYTLCICTNGSSEYVYSVLCKFGLIDLFEIIWSESFGFTKSMAVACLIEKFGTDRFIIVGDRTSDIEAARENRGISIGMTHGFGGEEVLAADYTAGSIQELEELIKGLREYFL